MVDAQPEQSVERLAEDVETMEIKSEITIDVAVKDEESDNPWAEQAAEAAGPIHRLSTPDPSALQSEEGAKDVFQDDRGSPEPEEERRVSQEVLQEFDPLADRQEWEARQAWSHAEGHPRPASTAPDKGKEAGPSTPSRELGTTTPSSPLSASVSAAFPALASIARSFSPLSRSRSRPRSIDNAANPITPSTLSRFADQQSGNAPGSSGEQSRPESTERGRSGSPRPAKEKGKDQFDFPRFLEQMKSRSAEPVAKYLRSFLSNFTKRTFTVNDQVKLIQDFLNFISARMREADVWRNTSDVEFDNAMEAMEKLVMNRLYDFTFTPQIQNVVPPRPITTDDLERDRVLEQRIALFGWVEEKHLDVPDTDESKGFMAFASQELLKISHYKAPRDKLICILNCCKVIFGLLRHLHKGEDADSFLPILIYVALKANPPHLISNLEYISRFRNPQKLQSETGYYLNSLMGAVSFIETMDHTALSNITAEEFEKNVEAAIQELPEAPISSHVETPTSADALATKVASPHAGEESAQPLSMSVPEQPDTTFADDTRKFLQRTGDTISKPLSALGRIFNDAIDQAAASAEGAQKRLSSIPGPFLPFGQNPEQERGAPPQTPIGVGEGGYQAGDYMPPIQTPYKPRVRPTTPASAQSFASSRSGTPDVTPSRPAPHTRQPLALGPSQPLGTPPHLSRTPTPSLDIAGLQAEIDNAHERAAAASMGTLQQIFPHMDKEIIGWVLEANGGDVGKSIEALLEMAGGE